jgi:hypothetical protein
VLGNDYCVDCSGSGEIFVNHGDIIECPYCDGTGIEKEE